MGATDNTELSRIISINQRNRKPPIRLLMSLPKDTNQVTNQVANQHTNQVVDQNQHTNQVADQITNQVTNQVTTSSNANSNEVSNQVITPENDQEDKEMIIDDNCEKVSDKILKMNKMDLPESLCFFMGRERANEIKAKKEQHLTLKADKQTVFYGEIVREHIEDQIKKLKNAYLTSEGWKSLVYDHDSTDFCTSRDVFSLRMKALYLMKLYKYSLQYFNSVKNFKDIASLAVMEVSRHLDISPNESEHYTITNPITLLRWFRMYRDCDSFTNILPINNAKRLPPILADNPEIIHSMKQFCKANISSLTVELVHNHIHTIIIPRLVKKIGEERNNNDYNKEMLFNKFNFKSLTISTVYKWMVKIGFKYQV